MVKDNNIIKMLKDEIGMLEEDINKITPESEEAVLNALHFVGKYRIVAEVVSISEICGYGLKPGMRYVVEENILNLKESTAPLCLGAIAPLYEKGVIIYDRMSRQQGDKPIEPYTFGYRCEDPGIELGGMGTVNFKVWVEEK
jgi:hypothetical protein